MLAVRAATSAQVDEAWAAISDVWQSLSMLVALAVILLVAWALGFGVFHVGGGLVHLLIILAVIAVVVHFARGRSTV